LDLRFSWRWLWTMVSSGLLRRVALVRTQKTPFFNEWLCQKISTMIYTVSGIRNHYTGLTQWRRSIAVQSMKGFTNT
jgi:hypothetical protein